MKSIGKRRALYKKCRTIIQAMQKMHEEAEKSAPELKKRGK